MSVPTSAFCQILTGISGLSVPTDAGFPYTLCGASWVLVFLLLSSDKATCWRVGALTLTTGPLAALLTASVMCLEHCQHQ